MQIDVIFILQITLTAALIVAYSLAVSIQEREADNTSESETILLAAFMIDNHPEVESLGQLTEATEAVIANSEYEVHWTHERLGEFRKSGKLPNLRKGAHDPLWVHLLALVFAPAFAIISIFLHWDQSRRYRYYRIVHTEIRRNYAGKALMLAAMSALYLVASLYLVAPMSHTWGVILAFVSGTGLCGAIVWLLQLTWFQREWKSFWQRQLREVAAAASSTAPDSDIRAQALMMKSDIERQPDVPIPSGIALLPATWSLLQLMLIWARTLLERAA